MKTFIIVLTLLTSSAHAACKVYTEYSPYSFGCDRTYFGQKIASAGLEFTNDPTTADVEISVTNGTEETGSGVYYIRYLVAYDQREAGTELTRHELHRSYESNRKRNRQEQQEQQQQQQGSYRCKEKAFQKIQASLDGLLAKIATSCKK